jgi:cell division protein ZipA
MRDWLTVIIVVLIIAILVDGVRRMRVARRDKIRMSPRIHKSPNKRDEPAAEAFTSELPNGGARVVAQREYTKSQQAPKFQRHDSRKPEQASLNLDEAVPMLMESVADSDDVLLENPVNKRNTTTVQPVVTRSASRPAFSTNERIEPTLFSAPDLHADSPDDRDDDIDDTDSVPAQSQTYAQDTDDENEDDEFQEDDSVNDFDDDEYYQEDEDDVYDEDEDDYQDEDEHYRESDNTPVTNTSAAAQLPAEPDEVLIINVMTGKNENFKGDELLDILLQCGMRFGDMDIFHRYSDSKGEGALLFSMANMVKPGTFDLDAMDDFETPGVSLFMTLPIKADSMQSFELMVDTARRIAEELDGEMKDEQRSVMTRQTIEHCRERIRDFERRRLFSRQR